MYATTRLGPWQVWVDLENLLQKGRPSAVASVGAARAACHSSRHDALASPAIAPYAPQESGPARVKSPPKGDLNDVRGVDNDNRRTLAPPQF
jgi:hypothetical protein